jgi:glycosyltransferase involved in cell wall biosynthesis
MALYRRVWRRRMRGYPIVLANSGFSAGHVERAWGRRADVVPPPVAGAPAVHPKRNRVVSLGRFIATDRKRLRAQLRALPRFLEHTDGSWALDMVGFCSDFDEDREFLDELRARSATLPVNFVVNAPRAAVDEALVGAKLFWHTAGLPDGEDVPARYQEHFGIATVEAMRAGCVPVVPDAGGQPEIVQHGIHGYLCRDVDDLVRHSVTVAGDERLRDRMSRAARTRSLEFAPELFDQRIRAHVEAALHRGSG